MGGDNHEHITLDIIREMMEIQERSYRSTLQFLVDDMKSEIKAVRKDVDELKLSSQFVSSKFDDLRKNSDQLKIKMEQIEDRIKLLETNLEEEDYYSFESRFEELEKKHEYLENMSRRNNIKILGLPEDKEKEKTWADTEEMVKASIDKQLDFAVGEIQIERAHRVGKPRDNRPRPVVARFTSSKQKEAILAKARQVKPKDMKFYQDLSSKTLERRAEQIPRLIQERKKGNIAYFVLDKLIIHQRNDRSKYNENDGTE